MSENDLDKIYDKFAKDLNFKMGKKLGSGSYGLVYEVSFKDSIREYAGKLLKGRYKDQKNEINSSTEFRGQNIIKVNKIYIKKYYGKEYSLILMEKAIFKDLGTFINSLIYDNILKLIFKNPFEITGDNLIRYFVKQLVEGLELLDRGSYCHFDIKPSNILIFFKMILKFTDLGLLRNIEEIKDENNKVKIPGGTKGFLSPEFYCNKYHEVSYEESIKYDFFALGVTIFYLKFGKEMLEYKKFEDGILTSDNIIKLLDKAMNEIKSEKLFDEDFIEFLCSLIQFKAKDRPNFEEIYRNKWLNRNLEEILEIREINETDEEKLLLELDKSDYLFEKKKYVNKMRNNNNNYENNINNDNNINNNNIKKQKKKFCRNKFVLKL